MKYAGEATSQPYISKVIISDDATHKKTKVTVKVAVRSMKGFPLNSMITSIVKIADKRLIEELSRNSRDVNVDLIEGARNPGQFRNLNLSIAEVRMLNPVNMERQKEYRIITEEFFVNRNTSDLTFYVVCQQNLSAGDRLASSRRYQEKVLNQASIGAEDVFKNGRRVQESKVFVYDNLAEEVSDRKKDYSILRGKRKIWTGPIHYYSQNQPRSDGYVGYAAGLTPSNAKQPKLNLVSSPNSTILDYRPLKTISNIQFKCTQTNESGLLAHKRNAYFSNLCITSDSNGHVKMFFAVDMGELLRNNVHIPTFIASEDEESIRLDPDKIGFKEIMELSVIKKISIVRQRVKDSGEFLDIEEVIKVIAESNQPRVSPVLLPGKSTTISMKNDNTQMPELKTMGGIKEVANLFSQEDNPHVRYFTATDTSSIFETDGVFKYSVKIQIEDGTTQFLTKLYYDLKDGLTALKSYYADVYDNGLLRSNYYKNKQGPWVWAIKSLIKAAGSFKILDIPLSTLEEDLYMLASPKTATRESVGKVIKVYEQVSSQIHSLFLELPKKSKRGSEDLNVNSVLKGTQKHINAFSISHDFEPYLMENNGISGYDFLGIPEDAYIGLKTITNESYSRRVRNEKLKFFKEGALNSTVINLDAADYSFLTPAVVKLGQKFVPTYLRSGRNVSLPSEMLCFNTLLDLYEFKASGKTTEKPSQVSIETATSKADGCDEEDLYATKLSSFSTQTKNNLSHAMSDINVAGFKKYESPCYDNTEKEESNYAQLMMPTTTSNLYKSEIQSRGIEETHTQEETGDFLNLSSVMAPLFFMKMLDITKEICCNGNALKRSRPNKSTRYTFLPNQLKALVANNAIPKLAQTKHNWFNNGVFALKEIKNAAFYFLNVKNLVKVEVFVGFESGMINAPNWQILNKAHVKKAINQQKPSLLCRLRPYVDEDDGLCFAQNKLLELNIFNQCFILDASKESAYIQNNKTMRKTVKAVDRMTMLDENDLLALESNFMRTNMKFGNVLQQINEIENFSFNQKKQQTTTTAVVTAPQATSPTTGGGSSSGGMY